MTFSWAPFLRCVMHSCAENRAKNLILNVYVHNGALCENCHLSKFPGNSLSLSLFDQHVKTRQNLDGYVKIWSSRPNSEDRINRKPDDQKNIRQKNQKTIDRIVLFCT